MRVAPVALVVIVGAAVILWFGNTLNSLVLGGLIGGLAALLISIPISLTLFSYLSRRHDEQLKAEAQEEMALAQLGAYAYPETSTEVYEAGGYMLPEEEYSEENNYYRTPKARNLPVASPYPRLPAGRQNQSPTSESSASRQRSTEYPLTPERPERMPKDIRGNATSTTNRRAVAGRQVQYPGFPGYKPGSERGSHQTAALRAARQEAASQQQLYSDTEFFPSSPSRKLPVVRTEHNLVPQPPGLNTPRTSRPLQQPQVPNQYRPKRTVDGSSVPPGNGRALPRGGETSANQTTESLRSRMREPQTDQLGRNPQTGSFRQQPAAPTTQQTGQIGRNPQLNAQRRNPDVISGSLKNPMVRRAPYMYEDDPLRQELAQQIEAPSIRRSSRYEEDEEY
jgi:hypothetical protein